MKEIIDKRYEKYRKMYSLIELKNFLPILLNLVEHPTKPGYKRQDILYLIDKIKDE